MRRRIFETEFQHIKERYERILQAWMNGDSAEVVKCLEYIKRRLELTKQIAAVEEEWRN